MLYFNFHELQLSCADEIPAIFVLTTGLTLHYNNYRFKGIVDFRFRCQPLVEFPTILFQRKLISRDKNTNYREYIVHYRTKNPQSYIRDTTFLNKAYSINEKVQYLKLLSYRTITDNNDWIPLDYVENIEKISNNRLLTIQNNKIYFNYEKDKKA